MRSLNVKPKIAIIGGGVVGLTTAACLSKTYEVSIIAEHFGIATDSLKASAIWHVYLVPETSEVLSWAQTTLEKLCDLEKNDPEAGVVLVPGVELFRKSGPAFHIPTWAHIPKLFKILTDEEVAQYNNIDYSDISLEERELLANNPVTWGYYIDAPAADMQLYLSWLEKEVRKQGTKFIQRRISSFDEVSNSYDVIVNCSGIGARELVNDKDFTPYKGQYFVLKASDVSPKNYVGDDYHPRGISYVIPRMGEVMVGGWAEKNCEDLFFTLDWKETISKAAIYTPWLRTLSPQEQARSPVVGIRPARTSGVRLELDTHLAKIPIIHNYGHGGSGFSLAWGCADAVLNLIAHI